MIWQVFGVWKIETFEDDAKELSWRYQFELLWVPGFEELWKDDMGEVVLKVCGTKSVWY